jgi:hypothetical protein
MRAGPSLSNNGPARLDLRRDWTAPHDPLPKLQAPQIRSSADRSRQRPRLLLFPPARIAVMKSCVEQGLLKTDPSAGVKLKHSKGPGFHTWSEDEIAQFEFHHRVRSKPRLAFALLLYTAQRRGDVIRIGAIEQRGSVCSWLSVAPQTRRRLIKRARQRDRFSANTCAPLRSGCCARWGC